MPADALQILVVDDDSNDLELTVEALDCPSGSTRVQAVNDGAEALDYLHCRGEFRTRPPGNPALLLLDLNMPRVDGWTVLREIRGDAALRTVPVVVFTSSTREREVERCYALGANAYVAKPAGYAEFATAVKEIRRFWTGRNVPPPRAAAQLAGDVTPGGGGG